MLTFTRLLHHRRNIEWQHIRRVHFVMDERSTCEDCHKPKISFTQYQPNDQVLCDDCWKSKKVDKWIWSDNEETDEDRNDTSIVIKTRSDQNENGEEIEKPEQKKEASRKEVLQSWAR